MSKQYLISVATADELSPLFIAGALPCSVLITGVGMMQCASTLSYYLSQHTFDYILHVGIAGAVNKTFKIGELVQVNKSYMPELGCENKEDFIPIDQLGLSNYAPFEFENTSLDVTQLKLATAWSVNKVHGFQPTIDATFLRYKADIETMESAAIASVCQRFKIPFNEVRCISNYVENRNRAAWDIPLAIHNLCNYVSVFSWPQ